MKSASLTARAPARRRTRPGSKGCRSSSCSPTPIELHGQLQLAHDPHDDPALGGAVELGEARRRVSPIASWNIRACAKPFWPVGASSTISDSWGAPGSWRSITRLSLASSSIRLRLGVQPAGGIDDQDVDAARRGRLDRVEDHRGRDRSPPPGGSPRRRSAPPTSRAARWPRRGTCRPRPGARGGPSPLSAAASLAHVVVLPEPLTPSIEHDARAGVEVERLAPRPSVSIRKRRKSGRSWSARVTVPNITSSRARLTKSAASAAPRSAAISSSSSSSNSASSIGPVGLEDRAEPGREELLRAAEAVPQPLAEAREEAHRRASVPSAVGRSARSARVGAGGTSRGMTAPRAPSGGSAATVQLERDAAGVADREDERTVRDPLPDLAGRNRLLGRRGRPRCARGSTSARWCARPAGTGGVTPASVSRSGADAGARSDSARRAPPAPSPRERPESARPPSRSGPVSDGGAAGVGGVGAGGATATAGGAGATGVTGAATVGCGGTGALVDAIRSTGSRGWSTSVTAKSATPRTTQQDES